MNKKLLVTIGSIVTFLLIPRLVLAQDSYFETKRQETAKTVSPVRTAQLAPKPQETVQQQGRASVLQESPAPEQPPASISNQQQVNSLEATLEGITIRPGWWSDFVTQPMEEGSNVVSLNLEQAVQLALAHSIQISIEQEVPLIRETSVAEADAAFDWTSYLESKWNDINEPIGSSLTVGNNGERYFNDHRFDSTAGLRRRTRSGAQVDLSQRIGFQNNNSDFFIPNNQGTSVLSLGFTQPLLRGRGITYNTSLNVLARIDVNTAEQELRRQIQSHVLEVFRSYWSIYLERGTLTQKIRLYLTTKDILERLNSRVGIDAQQSQVASAEAALATRKSELIRAQAAVKNAETRLKILLNAPELSSDQIEIVTVQPPTSEIVSTTQALEKQTAFKNRPEIDAALMEIKAGTIRHDVAAHEQLPILNLVSETYLSGLQGDSDIPQAFVDQFSDGAPSYSVGFNFEVPLGNRAALARHQRRTIELRQLHAKYENTLQTIGGEVEIAVRELQTSFQEIQAKLQALEASQKELEAIGARWARNVGGQGSAGLQLESLLRAQERVTQAEFEYLRSMVTYNLSVANLRRANGTLFQSETVADPTGVASR